MGGKRLRITRQHTFHHAVLREVEEDAFAQLACARGAGLSVLKRGCDAARHRVRVAAGKQRVVMGAENFRNSADIGGDHRNAGGRGLDHHVGHGVAAGGNNQQPALREAMPGLDVTNEAHRVLKLQAFDLCFQVGGFLAVAGKRQRDGMAAGAQPRDRVDQQVGALDVTEFADIDEIGRIRRRGDGIEFARADPVEDAADGR